MFETDVDGTPIPCDHPIRWYHKLAAWVHERIEELPFLDRQRLHRGLAAWVCEAYERVSFGFPCWQCESDRTREYGATTKSDADVTERLRPGIMGALDPGSFGYLTNSPDVEPGDPFAYDEDDDRPCPGGCGGRDCCGGHECNGDCQ